MSSIKKITGRYEEKLDAYCGDANDPRSVGWSDRSLQWKRFEALTSVAPLEGKSILDLGCGLGNLLDFLTERKWKGEYTGWDLSDKMIAHCQSRFPEKEFDTVNILDYDGSRKFDIIIGSGLFCVPLEDDSLYDEIIKKMFGLCREAIAFNMISTYVNYREDHLRYTNPCEIFDFCKNNLSRYVAIRHDYMPFDYAVYVYKRDD